MAAQIRQHDIKTCFIQRFRPRQKRQTVRSIAMSHDDPLFTFRMVKNLRRMQPQPIKGSQRQIENLTVDKPLLNSFLTQLPVCPLRLGECFFLRTHRKELRSTADKTVICQLTDSIIAGRCSNSRSGRNHYFCFCFHGYHPFLLYHDFAFPAASFVCAKPTVTAICPNYPDFRSRR